MQLGGVRLVASFGAALALGTGAYASKFDPESAKLLAESGGTGTYPVVIAALAVVAAVAFVREAVLASRKP